MRTALAEIKNNEKILERIKIEQDKLEERIEVVSNPNYMLDLREKINATKMLIEKTKKKNKQTDIENAVTVKKKFRIFFLFSYLFNKN
jgi:hypothetical protein